MFEVDLQPDLGFPEELAERYRPHSLDEFIGLADVKKVMAKYVARPYPTSWIFLGPPGVGKTCMGLFLAEILNAELHHMTAQSFKVDELQRIRTTCQYLPNRSFAPNPELPCKFHLVLTDEVNLGSPDAQNKALSYLDGTDPAPSTIWVWTCNETRTLHERFLSRSKVLNFTVPNDAVARHLGAIWVAETTVEASFARLAAIATNSSGNVRGALMSLETDFLMAA